MQRRAPTHLSPIDELYDAHGIECYRLAHCIVGAQDLANDVVQEAFLEAWIARDSFDPARRSVRAWLLSITHRKAVDLLRRNASQSVHASGLTASEFVELAYFGGYTQSEIARATGTALGTVKTSTLVALRQLRKNRQNG